MFEPESGQEGARLCPPAIVTLNGYLCIMSVRGPRKGENFELSVDLNSGYADKRKDAIKRTIASMTVGKGIFCSSYLLMT